MEKNKPILFKKKVKCSMCDRKAVGYIRTYPVCGRCFERIRWDNAKRIRLNIKIPKSLKMLDD